MACVNADGTLSPSARSLLIHLDRPLRPEEIAERLQRPLFQVRSSLREMSNAHLIAPEGEAFIRTEEGTRALDHSTG